MENTEKRLYHCKGIFSDGEKPQSFFMVFPANTTRTKILKNTAFKLRKKWVVRLVSDDYRIAEIYEAMNNLMQHDEFTDFLNAITRPSNWVQVK